MPKFLVHGTYTAEGLRGLMKDKPQAARPLSKSSWPASVVSRKAFTLLWETPMWLSWSMSLPPVAWLR